MKSSLTFDTEGAKNRPVSKVITLLKDMLKQLEKEAEEDEEIYDKMACWCETNDKEKTKSIADAEARISDLTTKIEELTANSARLNTEIRLGKDSLLEVLAAMVRWLPPYQCLKQITGLKYFMYVYMFLEHLAVLSLQDIMYGRCHHWTP